jgi:hypothetical protein
MHRNRRLWIAFAFSQACVLVLALMLAASSSAAAPKGNAGTVKVDGLAFDRHHANEPHPSCDFLITFWGYAEGAGPATATFTLQSPTKANGGPGTVVYGPIDIGSDPAGGGNDPDGEIAVNLATFLADSGATPHPIQGFHVKLTVNAPDPNGADVKHKVFWVKCASVGPTPTPTPTASVTPTPTPTPTVLGKTIKKPPTSVLGRKLARTGAPLKPLALLAVELALLGVMLMIWSRRGSRIVEGEQHR